MSFAIELTEDNLSEIEFRLTPFKDRPKNFDTYLAQPRRWYFVLYYQTSNGRMYDYSVIPEVVLKKNYDYDEDKINTEVTMIVRKEL